MNLREHVPLSGYTTLRTGGPARYFVEAASEADLREALQFAAQRQLPVAVLGGGSNLLAADHGFEGLVLRVANRGLTPGATQANTVEVAAEAGENWDALVGFCVERGLHGLENMSLIPGTVGAAVTGNIGAYGAEVKDTLTWAEALDRRTGTLRRFTASHCAFAYRRSFFKTAEGRHYIVVRAAFLLQAGGSLNTRYQDVADYFASHRVTTPTLADVREAVIAIRRRKLPDPEQTGTAGSFFKNPVIARPDYEALVRRFPGLPSYDDGPGRVKVPLGWVLDKVCGLKGARRGRVGTHAAQALVIINDGGTAAEVTAFADEITLKVKAATGIDIEWEVEKL